MIGRRSVRQLLAVLLAASILVVLIVGLVGWLAVRSSTASVAVVTDEVAPASLANAKVLQDMLLAQTSLRGYALIGSRSQLQRFRSAVAQFHGDDARLTADTHDPALLRLAVQQRRHRDAWLVNAEGRLARGGGSSNFNLALTKRGQALFDSFRHDNTAISRLLSAKLAITRATADRRLHTTEGLIIGFALGGGLVCLLIGWWVVRAVRRPLTRLEKVVGRLTRGDHAARASYAGPREIRNVGMALNEMADENDRAREVEQQIQSSLREMDSVRTDFVSNVSHELRTPLTIIAGYMELLGDDLEPDLTDEQRNMLMVTERNVARLRLLIEDLLTLNKAESSSTTLEHLDLAQLVADVVTDIQLTASQRHIRVGYRRPERLFVVLADAGQLHRAVLNLISNAVKFSHDSATVTVSLVAVDKEAVLAIADQGIGVPRADLEKLGSRFFRAHNAVSSQVAGTGLGLRIVQRIVGNHQGTLGLDSEEGVGTTVTIRLPLVGADQFDAPRSRSADSLESLN